VRSVDCRREDAANDTFGTFNIGRFARHDEPVAVCVQRHFERVFDGGEVTVVLSEQADAIR
jgi:hypothetical protein